MNGRLAALMAVIIWGIQFSVLADALNYIDAYHFSAIRFVGGAAILVVLLWAREGRASLRFDGRLGAAIGYGTAGFTAFSILLIVALGYAEPQTAALVAATGPILTQLMRWLFDDVRPHPAILALAVVALFGLAIVITEGRLDELSSVGVGDLLTLAAITGFSLYTYGASKFPGWSPLRFTTLTMIGGALTTVVVTIIADVLGVVQLPSADDLRSGAPHLGYIAVIGSVVAILFWTVGVRKLGPSNAVLFMNLTPIVALIVAVAGGADLTTPELIGAAVTVSALVAANLVNRALARRQEVSVVTSRELAGARAAVD